MGVNIDSITSWKSGEMDWNDPHPLEVKYYWALQKAILERNSVFNSELSTTTNGLVLAGLQFLENRPVLAEQVYTLASQINTLGERFFTMSYFEEQGMKFGEFGDKCIDSLELGSYSYFFPTVSDCGKFDIFDIPTSGVLVDTVRMRTWLKTAKAMLCAMRYKKVSGVSYGYDGDYKDIWAASADPTDTGTTIGDSHQSSLSKSWDDKGTTYSYASDTQASISRLSSETAERGEYLNPGWKSDDRTFEFTPYSVCNITGYDTDNVTAPDNGMSIHVYGYAKKTYSSDWNYVDPNVGPKVPAWGVSELQASVSCTEFTIEFERYKKPYTAMILLQNSQDDSWGFDTDNGWGNTYQKTRILTIGEINSLINVELSRYGFNTLPIVVSPTEDSGLREPNVENFLQVESSHSAWKNCAMKLASEALALANSFASGDKTYSIIEKKASVSLSLFGDFNIGFEFKTKEEGL